MNYKDKIKKLGLSDSDVKDWINGEIKRQKIIAIEGLLKNMNIKDLEVIANEFTNGHSTRSDNRAGESKRRGRKKSNA